MKDIEHIYVINLDKDTERLQHFKDEVGDAFTYTRIKGVEPLKRNKKLRIGQLGCLNSHILILEDAIKHNYKNILIFEDDIIVKDNWDNINTAINDLQYLKPNLLYLGCSQHKWKGVRTPGGKKEDVEIKDNYYHSLQSFGSFAVIINNSIYETLLNMYNNKDKPIDNYLVNYQLKNKHKCIVMYPNKVIADVTTSNTGNPRDQNKMAKKFRWI